MYAQLLLYEFTLRYLRYFHIRRHRYLITTLQINRADYIQPSWFLPFNSARIFSTLENFLWKIPPVFIFSVINRRYAYLVLSTFWISYNVLTQTSRIKAKRLPIKLKKKRYRKRIDKDIYVCQFW